MSMPREITEGVDTALAKFAGRRSIVSPPSQARPVVSRDDDLGKYIDNAVQDECDKISNAPDGSQNDTINSAAFSVGTIVGTGDLSETDAHSALLAAARSGGHPEQRALRSIASGLAAGMRRPRYPWPPVSRRNEEASLRALVLPESHTEAAADAAEAEETEAVAAFVPFKRGGAFFHDVPQTPPAVWGRDGDVLWAEGEALLIAAPQGVGKTTLVHQLVRARLGLQEDVLGLPVQQGSVVLLLAMDRPSQTRRAGARIFGQDDPDYLNQHLVVWEGPPPFDMAKRPDILAAMCQKAGADTVVIDSIKDAAIGLSADDVGAGYNRARQKALAEGVQVVEAHHMVKRGPNGSVPNTMADIYGSTWITSGAGSVVLLWGEAGDPIVTLRHLKQPMDEVGPLQLIHDHEAGTTSIRHSADLLEMARISGTHGLTAVGAAEAIFETKKASPSEREKARRRLDKLVQSGHLVRVEPTGPADPARYYLGGK